MTEVDDPHPHQSATPDLRPSPMTFRSCSRRPCGTSTRVQGVQVPLDCRGPVHPMARGCSHRGYRDNGGCKSLYPALDSPFWCPWQHDLGSQISICLRTLESNVGPFGHRATIYDSLPPPGQRSGQAVALDNKSRPQGPPDRSQLGQRTPMSPSWTPHNAQ